MGCKTVFHAASGHLESAEWGPVPAPLATRVVNASAMQKIRFIRSHDGVRLAAWVFVRTRRQHTAIDDDAVGLGPVRDRRHRVSLRPWRLGATLLAGSVR